MKIRWLATAVVQRPELETNRSVFSVPPPPRAINQQLWKFLIKFKRSEIDEKVHKNYSAFKCDNC